MKKVFLVFLFLLTFVIFLSKHSVFSQTRHATCDQCGFCQVDGTPKPTPGNWESCRNCLYPALSETPADNDGDFATLLIDAASNLPPTPRPGALYTMIGCINTNVMGGFTGEGNAAGASGSVVKTLLDIIFGIAGSISFIYIVYGAFLILTSQADPEKLNQGRKTIYGAIIGLIFCLTSVFLVNVIGASILKIPGFGQ